METKGLKPTFVDNQEGNTLSSAIKRHLKELRDEGQTPDELWISTAYFNPSGLQSIAKETQHVGNVKLLLGAEPTPESMRPVRQPGDPHEPELTNRIVVRALKELIEGLKRDRDYLPFDLETDRAIKTLLEFLASDKIEVRRYEGNFLHAKAFIFRGDNRGLVSGSSNLTYAGMNTNLELNLGHYGDPLVGQVETWFEDLWERAVPFDLSALYNEMLLEVMPYMVYLRVLFELYGEEIELEQDDEGEIPVTSFQKHGRLRAELILEKYGGVLIADGVGLGKTFIAGDLIRKYRDNRQRVLLICPASLRDSEWRKFLNKYQLLVDCVGYEQLANDVQFVGEDGKEHLNNRIDDYSLVVVDEAHNYRNPDTPTRAAILRQLLQGKRRDIVFLTATPVNNSLWDLYHLLRFFLKQDASLSDLGIRSIRSRFNSAMGEDPFNLNPDMLYPIIDATTVKRTRKFIKKHYANDTIPGPDGKPQLIRFPKPHALTINYSLDNVLPNFFDKFRDYLMPSSGVPLLTMARYKPEMYPKGKKHNTRDTAIVGLLRSIMLKRFESSAYAFRATVSTMIQQHEAFLDALERGYIIYKEFYKEWSAGEDTDIDELLIESDNTVLADNYNIVALKRDVENDLAILQDLLDDANQINRQNSPKLASLIETLVEIVEQAEKDGIDLEDTAQNRKVLIFSYYAQTVDWIEEHLNEMIKKDNRLSVYKGRLVSVSGRDSRNKVNRKAAISGFAPISTKAMPPHDKDKFDIMIATDVLAEGMNLQQCRNVINFDLPWNPMRLIQRHGRIDRIGSPYDDVYMRTFFPDDRLDDLLALEGRVRIKLAQAAASVGVEDAPIELGSQREANFSETNEEIKKLSKEDAAIYEEGGTKGAAQTGEEYRQELRKALGKYGDELGSLAWKIGSGMAKGQYNGFFFCAKVGKRTYLRFIGENNSEVIKEIGTCLRIIECTEETERKLDLDDYTNAIQAWKIAKETVYEDWTFETDPANLEPKVPKINRDVAEFLRSNPFKELETEELDKYLDIIETPWSRRETNQLRNVFKDESTVDNSDKTKKILETIDKLGIEPIPPQETLPPIDKDDIHLVCWLAITSSSNLRVSKVL